MMNCNDIMMILMALSAVVSIIFGNPTASAGFWVACAIFHHTCKVSKE